MKKHLPIILLFLFIMPTIWANDIYYEITEGQSVYQIQNDLQNTINNAANNDKIIVTGSKTNVDVTLFLNIPANKTVIWKANYQASIAVSPLLSLSGNGTFEVSGGVLVTSNGNTIYGNGTSSTVIVSANSKVKTSGGGVHAITTKGNVEIKENAVISGTIGEVIETTGDNSIVTMSGGSVTATSENAIIAQGINAKVFVSGGILSNMATIDPYPVIFMRHQNNNQLNVQISGTAKVVSSGKGFGIYSYGNVDISGNAYIGAAENHAIYTGGSDSKITISGESKIEATGSDATIWMLGRAVEVKDNAHVIAKNAMAIYILSDDNSLTISGTSKVEAAGWVQTIETSAHTGTIEVKDKAQVIAKKYPVAITNNKGANIITISGGAVFAPTSNINLVVSGINFNGPTENGVILAWGKGGGTPSYEIFSTTDILLQPTLAFAYWDKKGNLNGISYAMGANTGFIPLDVNVLSVKEPVLSNITLYPNPTTGVLNLIHDLVTNDALHVTGVEVFDIYGKKQSHASHVTSNDNTINIAHLPAGLYFVKIRSEAGEVVKKVIKL